MISFTDPQRKFLVSEAKSLGLSVAELVRRLVDEHIPKTKKALSADKPSTDELTQRYRTVLRRLNFAPIGNLSASDLSWLTGQLEQRWRANARQSDLSLPTYDAEHNLRTVKRLELIADKAGTAAEIKPEEWGYKG